MAIFEVVGDAFSWIGDGVSGAFDWASGGVTDLFGGNFSATDLGQIFGDIEAKDIVSLLGGKGGGAGALSTIVSLLRGGGGAYTDILRSDFMIEKYAKELAIYQEQLGLLGIETPLQIGKIQNEMGWLRDQTALQQYWNTTEASFTEKMNGLRGNQIDARIGQMRAELELFGPRLQTVDLRQQGVRDTLDIRTKIMRGDMDALNITTDLDIKGLENQAAAIQKLAEFEAGTRRVQMVREEARGWVTAAHYGVHTGGPSSAGHEATFASMMGKREIAHILGMANLRQAGINLQIEKADTTRDAAIRRAEGELELMNRTAANQLALMDIEKVALGIQQKAAMAGISAAEIDKDLLAVSTAFSLAKASYQNNLLGVQLAYRTNSLEADLDLVEARADSRGRILDIQIQSTIDLIELAESQGDFALFGRGLDLLAGPGMDIASNLLSGKSGTGGLNLSSADPLTEYVGSYATDYGLDYSALGTE